jgi:plasmid stabilization system protein ParE
VDHYRLLFTQRALDDLAKIVGYIAEDDEEAAYRFGASLLDHVGLLEHFPRMGTVIRKRSSVRRLVHAPILVYYKIHEATGLLEILHFRHGSRKPMKS